MNKKIIIGISIGTVLVLTIVGAVIYKMLPPKAGEETNTQTQREDGLLLEGDDLNAIEAEENIVVVDGDPDTSNNNIYAVEYIDENGESVRPEIMDRSKINIQNVDYYDYVESEDYFLEDSGDFDKVNLKYNAKDNCVYNYDQLYTEQSEINSLPSMNQNIFDKNGNTIKACYTASGGIANKDGNLNLLYIFATDNLRKIDLSGEDLSKYDYIEIFNANKIETIDIGNYYPGLVKNSGWHSPTVHLFTGIKDTSTIKQVNVSNLEMAKWIKKEVSPDCKITINGESIQGNLEYIYNTGTVGKDKIVKTRS